MQGPESDILANAEKKKSTTEEMLWQSLSTREQQATLAMAMLSKIKKAV